VRRLPGGLLEFILIWGMIMANSSARTVSVVAGAAEKRGEKIPNSKYYRDFCFVCGEAMRVEKFKLKHNNPCQVCCKFAFRDNPGVRQAERQWLIDTAPRPEI